MCIKNLFKTLTNVIEKRYQLNDKHDQEEKTDWKDWIYVENTLEKCSPKLLKRL